MRRIALLCVALAVAGTAVFALFLRAWGPGVVGAGELAGAEGRMVSVVGMVSSTRYVNSSLVVTACSDSCFIATLPPEFLAELRAKGFDPEYGLRPASLWRFSGLVKQGRLVAYAVSSAGGA